MNSSKKSKIKYICELNNELGYKRFLRKEFIQELNIWGKERIITEQTFNKRVSEGYRVEYRTFKINKQVIKNTLDDINDLIDLSLFLKDEIWFYELINQKKIVEKHIQ